MITLRRTHIQRILAIVLPLIATRARSAETASVAPAIRRTSVLNVALSELARVTHVDVVRITLPPHTTGARHRHPCPVIGLVDAGVVVVQVEGQQPREVKAGEVFYEPANTPIARFDNTGDTPATFTACYLKADSHEPTIELLRR